MSAPVLDPIAPHTASELLVAHGLVKRFGGVNAVDGVELSVAKGEPLAVIGPNGAGKSTLLKLIAGELAPDDGEVLLEGVSYGRASAHQIARQGVGLAHQVPMPFARLTVRENVRVGALHRHHLAYASRAVADRVLERCGIEHLAARAAGSLTLLDLKRLELARALSLEPKLLLLDEVASGLMGRELRTIIELVASIRDEGVTLIVVEHVESVVRELVERVVVLDWGKIIARGTPAEIAGDARVREIYLGSGHSADGRRSRVSRHATDLTAGRMAGAALRLRGVRAGYGSITALRGVDLDVAPGELIAVLGANGAGKSTLARAISGLTVVRGGTMELDASDITGLAAHERARLGVAHCQEGRRVFGGLTVEENLILAARTDQARAGMAERRRWVNELFPILGERRNQAAQTLSGGQQQMLAIARAVMAYPRLVVFDEISLGLAPAAIDTLYGAIAQIRDAGISIIVVEQNVHRSLALADRAYVLERGRVSFCGDPEELLDEDRLETAYFGTGAATVSEAAAAPVTLVQHGGE